MWTNRIALALAAGLGLGLLMAGIVILVWWNVSARQQPLQVVANATPLETLLENAPYIALNEGDRPVYVIAPRASSGLETWLSSDAAELAAQGRQVRVIMVPSGHGGGSEEATIAELWLGQDIDLLEEWMSMRAEHWTAIGIAPSNATPERLAVLAEARAFAQSVMQAVGQGRDDNRWPVIVWRDGANQLAACLCQSPSALNEARYALRLSGQYGSPVADTPMSEPQEPPYNEVPYEEPYEDSYPRLNYGDRSAYPDERERDDDEDRYDYRTPSPVLPGDTSEGVVRSPAPAPSTARPVPERPQQTAPTRPRPAPRELNTAPPKAEKDAESLFY